MHLLPNIYRYVIFPCSLKSMTLSISIFRFSKCESGLSQSSLIPKDNTTELFFKDQQHWSWVTSKWCSKSICICHNQWNTREGFFIVVTRGCWPVWHNFRLVTFVVYTVSSQFTYYNACQLYQQACLTFVQLEEFENSLFKHMTWQCCLMLIKGQNGTWQWFTT